MKLSTSTFILTLILAGMVPAHAAGLGGDSVVGDENETTIDLLLRKRELRLDSSCKVEDFFAYEFPNNGPTSSPIDEFFDNLDMTDYASINIEAVVTANCRPACVKLTFAGTVRKETSAPYSLYGDTVAGGFRKGTPRLSGLQQLKACLYTDSACTRGEQGCKSNMVDVIPANTPLMAGPYVLPSFKLVFDNVSGPATAANTAAAATAICQSIREYWSVGAFYRTDIRVDPFECTGRAVSGAQKLTLQLNTKATVTKWTGSNPYLNRRLPSSGELYTTMTNALDTNDFMGPLDQRIIEYFVEVLNDSSNPYSAVTSFSIV